MHFMQLFPILRLLLQNASVRKRQIGRFGHSACYMESTRCAREMASDEHPEKACVQLVFTKPMFTRKPMRSRFLAVTCHAVCSRRVCTRRLECDWIWAGSQLHFGNDWRRVSEFDHFYLSINKILIDSWYTYIHSTYLYLVVLIIYFLFQLLDTFWNKIKMYRENSNVVKQTSSDYPCLLHSKIAKSPLLVCKCSRWH